MLNGLQTIRRSDFFLGVFVIAITAMLLIPLPTPLLDVLLVLNISFSLLLLVVGLYMPNALALLAFPSLLLLTTLFRLGLNVASTRLILSQGDAGEVIQAFGTFLIQGELLVGVIIFLIITIVNYVVIAKGSSRVSEVAARFALDALPGKQMAIDSDLRAGLLTAQEAERRREELRKESQLFGSMDGAMKFVQGDAIAGFFIIVTNIVGGLSIGLMQGMGLGDAVETYTMLTVGDGLVSQIPALLISICAGIVVTRVASDDSATLGFDVGQQLFNRPSALYFSGAVLFALGALPLLPTLPFFLVGGVLCFLGFILSKEGRRTRPVLGALPDLPRVQGTHSKRQELLGSERTSEQFVVVELDSQTLYQSYHSTPADYEKRWADYSRDFRTLTGVPLPVMSVQASNDLETGGYRVTLNGVVIVSGVIPLDCVLLDLNPTLADTLGLSVVADAKHPISGGLCFWTENSHANRASCQAAGFRTNDFFDVLTLELGSFLRRHPELLLTVQEIYSRLKEIESNQPGYLSDLLEGDFMNLSRVSEVIQQLIREGVGVKRFSQVVESLGSYSATYGAQQAKEGDFVLSDIVSFVRLSQRKQILSSLVSSRRSLRGCLLSPETEEIFSSFFLEAPSASPKLSSRDFERLQLGFDGAVSSIRQRGVLPVVVVCPGAIRTQVSWFLRQIPGDTPLICEEELEPSIELEPAAVWAVS